MRFSDIIDILPSTAYIKIRVGDTELIRQAVNYKRRDNSDYDKKKVVMIVPYCISEQEAWYYGVSPAMLEIVLK